MDGMVQAATDILIEELSKISSQLTMLLLIFAIIIYTSAFILYLIKSYIKNKKNKNPNRNQEAITAEL